MRSVFAIPLAVLYVLVAFTGITVTSIALDKLEQRGVVDIPEDNPALYSLERYAESIEYLFALDKKGFINDRVKERVIEGYKYSDYCEKFCDVVVAQIVTKPGYQAPPFCVAYCQNEHRDKTPEVPPEVNRTKVCPMIYDPVICPHGKYPNLCFAVINGEDTSKCRRSISKPAEGELPPEPIPSDKLVGIPEKIKKELPKRYGIPEKRKGRPGYGIV